MVGSAAFAVPKHCHQGDHMSNPSLATSNASKLRVGIIGAGTITWYSHLPGYSRLPDVEVVALCDLDEVRAQKLADEFGVPRTFADYEIMLRQETLDVVSVCTPNALHAPMTIAALEAGAHVLCEKPMAVTTAEAQAMTDAARRTGRKLSIGWHHRFRTDIQLLKRAIEDGLLGNIYYAKASMLRASGIPGYGTWFTNKDLAGGGAMMDIGVHALDLVLWLMGHPRPAAVTGTTYAKFGPQARRLGGWSQHQAEGPARFDVDDLATAFIRFENGATLTLEASWAGYSGSEERLQLFGEAGGAEIFPQRFGREQPLRLFGDVGNAPSESTPTLPHSRTSAHERLIEAWIDSIKTDKPLLITPEQGIMVTQIIEAIYRSAKEGQEVRL
jgi:predicted dehydrogenase